MCQYRQYVYFCIKVSKYVIYYILLIDMGGGEYYEKGSLDVYE